MMTSTPQPENQDTAEEALAKRFEAQLEGQESVRKGALAKKRVQEQEEHAKGIEPSDPKPRYLRPLLLILSPWLLVLLHLCHLRSSVMEVAIPAILLCILVPLVGRGRINVLLAFTASVVVTFAYLTWLHSPTFPRCLLDKSSLEMEQ
jgi:hypothetical protein